MKKTLKKGFTLVELVIVIAVIAILSAVLIPTFGNVIQNSKDTAAYQNASNAVNSYLVDQASQENNAVLGEGYIVVLEKAHSFKTNEKLSVGSSAYVFGYDGNTVTKLDGKYKKGPSTAKELDITGLTVTAGTTAAATWTAAENVTAIPLNYKLTTDSVSATVWWVKTNPLA